MNNITNSLRMAKGSVQADRLSAEMEVPLEHAPKVASTLVSFLRSYKNKSADLENVVWLYNEFEKYPHLWGDMEALRRDALEVIEEVESYRKACSELASYHDRGLSTQHWLAHKMEEGTKTSGSDLKCYLHDIDAGLFEATHNNIGVLRNDVLIDGVPYQQRKMQLEQEQLDALSNSDMCRRIEKTNNFNALLPIASHGTRILGRRVWNALRGKENVPLSDDIKEFLKESLKSSTGIDLAVPLSGGAVVVAKSGWLGDVLKKTPVGTMTNTVSMGVDKVRTLYKYATGELSSTEALDEMATSAASMLGSLAAKKGASVGASIGAVFGPIGTAVGGFLGGAVGSMAGSTVGQAIYKGAKSMASCAAGAIKSVASSIGRGISSVCSGISSAFSSVCSLFSW